MVVVGSKKLEMITIFNKRAQKEQMVHSFDLRIAHHTGGCWKLVAISRSKIIQGKDTIVPGEPIEYTNFFSARGFTD